MMSTTNHAAGHPHIFLGDGHARNERKVWAVIALTVAMMVVEIVAGSVYGSMALVANGLHMSTHAAAMLIAAGAYFFARKYATNPVSPSAQASLGTLPPSPAP